MDRAFLDNYHRLEREHWWSVVRAGIITDAMQRLAAGKGPLRILNVGAATGRSTEILQPFGSVRCV